MPTADDINFILTFFEKLKNQLNLEELSLCGN